MVQYLPIILMIISILFLTISVFILIYYENEPISKYIFLINIIIGLFACFIFIYDRSPKCTRGTFICYT